MPLADDPFNDPSQQQQQQRQLQLLAQLQAVLHSSMSHDVRTPLSALALNAELVARASETPALQQAALRIKSALSDLGLQIDHLLAMAAPQPDTGLQPLFQAQDLRTLVQQRLQALTTQPLAGAAWVMAGEGDTRLSADTTLLEDAVDGLLRLAARFAGPGPVTVTVDGQSQRTVGLRIHFAATVPDAEWRLLRSATPRLPDMANLRTEPAAPTAPTTVAWSEAVSSVRSHGGSLVARSRPREGTLFACLLPRFEGPDLPL